MLNLNKITQEIEEEADDRLKNDPVCPGGKNAKLHSVLIEIGLAVGKIMEKEANKEE